MKNNLYRSNKEEQGKELFTKFETPEPPNFKFKDPPIINQTLKNNTKQTHLIPETHKQPQKEQKSTKREKFIPH